MTKHNERVAKRRWAVAGVIVACAAIGGATAADASNQARAQVTSGDFVSFAAADAGEQAIAGHAQMVRRANGTTKVSIHVTGLEPGATYGSHVHAAPCGTNDADGHYNFGFAVSGGAGPGNAEIWPGPVVANGGGVANGKATVAAIAGPSAVSVVIHRSTGEKIACADLR
jgi:superoxide dismutase, Cu-Zn family